jgi:hypothetical protein
MQPKPDAPISFAHLDRYIDDIEAAGLRCLIPFVYDGPLWKDPDWFMFYHGYDSDIPSSPSYTNPQTLQEIDELAQVAIERYKGRPVQFIFSIPLDGEFCTPFMGAIPRSEPMGISNEQFIEWVVARQRALVSQCNEVWSAYHLMDYPSFTDDLYGRLRAEWPDAAHYAIQFTHWHHPKHAIDAVDHVHQEYGVLYFAGADYVSGLRHNTQLAIEHETGLICSPVSIYAGGGRLDRWHLEEIRWCLQEFACYVH